MPSHRKKIWEPDPLRDRQKAIGRKLKVDVPKVPKVMDWDFFPLQPDDKGVIYIQPGIVYDARKFDFGSNTKIIRTAEVKDDKLEGERFADEWVRKHGGDTLPASTENTDDSAA